MRGTKKDKRELQEWEKSFYYNALPLFKPANPLSMLGAHTSTWLKNDSVGDGLGNGAIEGDGLGNGRAIEKNGQKKGERPTGEKIQSAKEDSDMAALLPMLVSRCTDILVKTTTAPHHSGHMGSIDPNACAHDPRNTNPAASLLRRRSLGELRLLADLLESFECIRRHQFSRERYMELADHLELRRLRPGEVLVMQGDKPPNKIFLLFEGRMAAKRQRDANLIVKAKHLRDRELMENTVEKEVTTEGERGAGEGEGGAGGAAAGGAGGGDAAVSSAGLTATNSRLQSHFNAHQRGKRLTVKASILMMLGRSQGVYGPGQHLGDDGASEFDGREYAERQRQKLVTDLRRQRLKRREASESGQGWDGWDMWKEDEEVVVEREEVMTEEEMKLEYAACTIQAQFRGLKSRERAQQVKDEGYLNVVEMEKWEEKEKKKKKKEGRNTMSHLLWSGAHAITMSPKLSETADPFVPAGADDMPQKRGKDTHATPAPAGQSKDQSNSPKSPKHAHHYRHRMGKTLPASWVAELPDGALVGMLPRSLYRHFALLERQRTDSALTVLLQAVPLMRDVPAVQRGMIARMMSRRVCSADEIILQEGHPCPGLYIVAKGKCKVVTGWVQEANEAKEKEERTVGRRLAASIRKASLLQQIAAGVTAHTARTAEAALVMAANNDSASNGERDDQFPSSAGIQFTAGGSSHVNPGVKLDLEASVGDAIELDWHSPKLVHREAPQPAYPWLLEGQHQLGELRSKECFGERTVLRRTSVDKTGKSILHEPSRCSVVALSKVEILFIKKVDLFAVTSYETRQLLRENAEKLQSNKMFDALGGGSDGVTAETMQAWEQYKKEMVSAVLCERERKVELRRDATALGIAGAAGGDGGGVLP
jgi:CRP-like cAMP-binding protein